MSEEIIKLIDNIGLSQIKDKLIKEAKVSIRMNTKVVDEEEIDLGASKIGGLPHLPKDIKWINNEEVPLSFIAQINMRDTMPHDVEKYCLNQELFIFSMIVKNNLGVLTQKIVMGGKYFILKVIPLN